MKKATCIDRLTGGLLWSLEDGRYALTDSVVTSSGPLTWVYSCTQAGEVYDVWTDTLGSRRDLDHFAILEGLGYSVDPAGYEPGPPKQLGSLGEGNWND